MAKTPSVAKQWQDEATEIASGGFWKPESPGEHIRGKLQGIRREQGKYKNSVADIRLTDGTVMAVGLTTMLEARVTDDLIGHEIGIIYEGEIERPEKDGGNYKHFRIFDFDNKPI